MDESKLSKQQLHILKDAGTEAPFSGEYLDKNDLGHYKCAGCSAMLFSSNEKYDAGTGWPSFKEAIAGATIEKLDTSHNMIRTEVVCANCGGHLGHVFDTSSAVRSFCINSLSLDFDSEKS